MPPDRPLKIILDTNALLAAFFGSGLCHTLVERLLEDDGVEIVFSLHIIGEFREHAEVGGIPIITPRAMYERLGESRRD